MADFHPTSSCIRCEQSYSSNSTTSPVSLRLWVNPSFDNVTDIKWSSVLRLRAVENRFFALCTLHCDVNRRRTHPFAFSPDGTELSALPVPGG